MAFLAVFGKGIGIMVVIIIILMLIAMEGKPLGYGSKAGGMIVGLSVAAAIYIGIPAMAFYAAFIAPK